MLAARLHGPGWIPEFSPGAIPVQHPESCLKQQEFRKVLNPAIPASRIKPVEIRLSGPLKKSFS